MFHIQRRHIWLGLLVLVMLIAPVVTTAQSPQGLPEPTRGEDPAAYDAKIYAAQFGITAEEAMQRFALQDAAGDLEAELSLKEVATFAGLWIEHTPEFRVVVQFTDAANKEITPYIQNKDLAAVVEIRVANIALVDLKKAQSEASSTIAEAGIVTESDINVRTNRVELYVVERARLDNAIQERKVQLPTYVEVVTVSSLSNLEADIYGGLTLSTCTSGFAVKKSDGTKGITTAAHCSDTQEYGSTTLTFENEERTGSYDVQWHTASGYTVKNLIRWSSNGTTRSITATKSRSSQAVGGYVCKYGKTSNYTCGYIFSKDYKPSSVPNSNATFIRVDNTAGYNDLSSGGDSGGPWFLTSTAYGTHVGSPAGDSNDAFYMAVNYMSGIGVSVMTAP